MSEQPSREIGTHMDAMPLTVLHLVAVAVCTLGFVFDLFEMAMGSVLGSVFSSSEYAIPSSQLSWLLASVYLGAIVGAPLLGWLADRQGKRTLLALALAWLCVGSIWAAFSRSTAELSLARSFCGIALGAYPPLMLAYFADILPTRWRGRVVFWACGLGVLGLPCGIFFVRSFGDLSPLGLDPWRWALLVGALGAGVTSALVARLPESPRWLYANGKLEEAAIELARFDKSHPLSDSIKDPPPNLAQTTEDHSTERSEVPIYILFFFSPFATVAFPILMGLILNTKGLHLADVLLFVGLSNFGPTLGSIASSLIIDRLDRRVALGLCATIMIAAGSVFCVADSGFVLAAAAILFTIAGVLYTTTINLYATELFPTQRRASSTAFAWSLNRLGAVLALLVLIPLLKAEGSIAMFTVIAASLLVSLVLLVQAPKGLEKRSVT